MKRVLSFVFALFAAVTFCISAFAGTVTSVPSAETAPIKATYVSSGTSEVETVFSVDISWGSLEYTYKLNDDKTWNPEKLAYETSAETAEWTCEDGADTITVTNHSNTAVTATFAYTQSTGYTGITGSFTGESLEDNTLSLEAPAENSDVSSAPSGSVILGLDGEFSNVEANTQIGSVTVTIIEKPEETGPIVANGIYDASGNLLFSLSETNTSGIYESPEIDVDSGSVVISYLSVNDTKYYFQFNNTNLTSAFFNSYQEFYSTDVKNFSLTIRSDAPAVKLVLDTSVGCLTVYNLSQNN